MLNAPAATGAPLLLPEGEQSVTMAPVFEYFEDAEGALTISEVLKSRENNRFAPKRGGVLNLGFSDSSVWIKMTLVNNAMRSAGDDDWFLEIANPLLDRIDLYLFSSPDSYRIISAGDLAPFQCRQFNHRNFIFTVNAPPGSTRDVYLNFKTSSSMLVPVVLKNRKSFIDGLYHETLLFGVFYGVIAIMFLYNAFLFVSIRDRSYLYYSVYVLSYFVYQFSMDGFAFQYFWPTAVWWANKCIPFLTGVACILTIGFSKSFLAAGTFLPRLSVWLSALQGVFLSFIMASLFMPYRHSIRGAGILMMVTACSLLAAGVLTFLRGGRSARFYIVAWTGMLLSSVVFGLTRFGALPNLFITQNAQHLGALFEVVLLSFALGDRINIMEKEKEDAQRQAIENLHKADVLKDEFLANTSHELRTPLNGIIGLADSLIDGVAGALPPKAVSDLSMISSSGRRLANLVNDILDYSKLRHREIELRRKPVDIKTAADGVIELSRPLAAGKNIVLVNAIAPGSGFVLADEDRLQQILLNLTGNAIKFTHAGTVEISSKAENGRIAVSVSDTGIGMPAGSLDRIFESFEQVDGSISREYGGTGIGLSITRRLVELHGGAIRVTSEPGKGSVFTFTLPRAGDAGEIPAEPAAAPRPADDITVKTADEALSAHPPALEHPHPAGERNRDRALVHIVDDDPVNLQVLENHLLINNYDVVRSPDGFDAIDKIGKGLAPDLMLLDIMMPGMSGYEVSKKIREKHQLFDLPVMMLTAKNRIDDMVAGFASGADDYLTKPFDRSELLARVKTLVTLKRAVRESRRLSDIDRDMEVARKILQTAIPEGVPVMSSLDIAVKYIPMESVGGDYYDFHVIDHDSIGVFISDVSGHGVTAALIASMVKIVFNMVEPFASDPVRLLNEMNGMLMGNIETHFLTSGYAYINIAKKTLSYARAGHEPVIVRRKQTDEYVKHMPGGRAIGIDGVLNCKVAEVPIDSGDRIVLYTDGIIEAMSPSGQMYGSRNFMNTIKSSDHLGARELADLILSQLFKWTGRSKNLDDDFSLVIVDVR